jgi:hypothetical protein
MWTLGAKMLQSIGKMQLILLLSAMSQFSLLHMTATGLFFPQPQ